MFTIKSLLLSFGIGLLATSAHALDKAACLAAQTDLNRCEADLNESFISTFSDVTIDDMQDTLLKAIRHDFTDQVTRMQSEDTSAKELDRRLLNGLRDGDTFDQWHDLNSQRQKNTLAFAKSLERAMDILVSTHLEPGLRAASEARSSYRDGTYNAEVELRTWHLQSRWLGLGRSTPYGELRTTIVVHAKLAKICLHDSDMRAICTELDFETQEIASTILTNDPTYAVVPRIRHLKEAYLDHTQFAGEICR